MYGFFECTLMEDGIIDQKRDEAKILLKRIGETKNDFGVEAYILDDNDNEELSIRIQNLYL